MIEYPILPDYGQSIIVVRCLVNGYKLRFALDTGASDTILDKNALMVFEGELAPHLPSITLETASGRLTAEAGVVRSFEALGKRQNNYTVHVYDFLLHEVFTEIDGILGLDFFAGQKLCIDFRQSTITLT